MTQSGLLQTPATVSVRVGMREGEGCMCECLKWVGSPVCECRGQGSVYGVLFNCPTRYCLSLSLELTNSTLQFAQGAPSWCWGYTGPEFNMVCQAPARALCPTSHLPSPHHRIFSSLFFFFLSVLAIALRAVVCMPGKCSTSEPHPSPTDQFGMT